MKSLKFLLCSTLMVASIANAETNPTKDHSGTRQRANAAYNELEYGEAAKSSPVAQASASTQSPVLQAAAKVAAQQNQNVTASSNLPKPVIMVMPAPSGQKFTVQEVVASNPNARATMEGVMEYLTKKGYEVKSLEGSSDVNNFIQMQNDIAGTDDDMSYLASLSLNADIYIKFSGFLTSDGQVYVELSAFESSTAKQVGSSSGSIDSHGRTSPVDMKANLKSAAHKAMAGIESRLLSYWQDDLKQGAQYKVIMNLKGEYSNSQLEDLQEDIVNNLRGAFNKVRVNAMTEKTIDLVVYADSEKLEDAQSVYSAIRKQVKTLAETKKISVTKKLIIMDVN